MDASKGRAKNGSKNNFSSSLHSVQHTSLSTLIVWNISKALEESPSLDIKEAVASTQSRLEQISDAGDIQMILSDNPYERHLACALLAWQQLGHQGADSLCRFVENKTKKEETPFMISSNHETPDMECMSQTSKGSKISSKIASPGMGSVSQKSGKTRYEEAICFSSFNSLSMGPVVKLPVESKVVMRIENTPRSGRSSGKKNRQQDKDINKKIDQACCMESACAERLAAMDATSAELRARVGTLARREAERVELLERAEAAWKDLEHGYQRRLRLAEEKEEDIAKQITKMLEERVNYKKACMSLAEDLKDRSERAEKERTRLTELEQAVCERACLRMRASEDSAKGDAVVAEQACRTAQLDRDLQFKEQQARRNMLTLQNEVAAVRALTCDAERATRGELGALRDQIAEVSNKLLDEDAQNENTKAQLENLRQEKMEIIEDLDGCKVMCDGQMQGKMDELAKKRKQLAELSEKVMECRCKGPVDIAVEAKRTPSLAALCKCSPEDKVLECCSCTSMRSKLLSNLFEDLFGGLQAELSGTVTLMPCQLLKCLEDKHNWDRASIVKSNLKNYFTKLLVGELDIAIATSIENYHAKWVGISCADVVKSSSSKTRQARKRGEDADNTEGWQERAVERRAQKLASELAEQLFQERAEELHQRAHELVNAGPPPCECHDKAMIPEVCSCGKTDAPALPPPPPPPPPPPSPPASPPKSEPGTEKQVYWYQALQDFTQLQRQVEDLKKDSLKKNDLKTMEDRFEKFIQLASVGGPPERDLNDQVEWNSTKRAHARGTQHGADAKKISKSVKSVAIKDNVACSCPVKHSGGGASAPPSSSPSWQRAMQDVALLRFQLEDLKKESIKKEDLKLMEDKLAKIINRASGSMASTNSKTKYVPVSNVANETNKYSKINRVVTVYDNDKSTTSKKKMFGSSPKETKPKSILSRGLSKPFKKMNQEYAVNLCLCSTKRQEQKELFEKLKLEASTWKKKYSKDIGSELSSVNRQSKPIADSFLSEDISEQTYSKEYDCKSCPSNCVCFHKIPSNTSLDQLLDTLSKWKGDLNSSFSEKYPDKVSCCDLSKINYRCSMDDSTTFKSNVSLKSREKSKEISEQRRREKDLPCCQCVCGIEPSNTKVNGNINTKSIGPYVTDSVYMGAVNLDKSQEQLCECSKTEKKIKSPFKCIISSKCSCEKLESKNTEKQIIHVKKENWQETGIIGTKQERRVNDIIKLPNTPNMVENREIKSSQLPNIRIDKSIADKKGDAQMCQTSDYQIDFLGVTLVDVNTHTRDYIISESNKSGYYYKNTTINDPEQFEKYKLSNRNVLRKIDRNKPATADNPRKSNYPVPELTSNIEMLNINPLMKNDEENKYSHCFINNSNKKQTSICKTYYGNEDINKNYDEQAMMLSYNMEGSDICNIHNNTKYKKDDRVYKTTNDKNTSLMGSNNKEHQTVDYDVNVNKNNSNDSEFSKKSYETAFESHHSLNRTIKPNNEENFAQNVAKINETHRQDIKTAPGLVIPPCKCSIQLNEFKDFIMANYFKNTANEDVALDVQSMKYFKERDESCVCCSKLNNENCKDLEDNAFHLLEEYMKKKLSEFRASTYSSFCIPIEEEEKIFDIIVQRVKRLISDSTKQIACKCSTEQEKSQGSWNRAYGLLQEYLKIKIKKIQCSCLLAEDNKDTILPDVLEKISNLIEYDFQRLKKICVNEQNVQENKHIDGKLVKFKGQVPEKDQIVLTTKTSSIFSPLDDQVSHSTCQAFQSNYIQQSMESQLPPKLGVSDEYYGPQDTKTNLDIDNPSFQTLHINKNCDRSLANTVTELYDKNTKESENNPDKFSSVTKPTAITDNISIKTTSANNKKYNSVQKSTHKSEKRFINDSTKQDFFVKKSAEKSNKREKQRNKNELNDNLMKSKSHSSAFVKFMNSINSKKELKAMSGSCKTCHYENTVSKSNEKAQNNKANRQKQEISDSSSCEAPYIGYTITCACDENLGPCKCAKNIPNTDPRIINDLMKKSKPDEAFFEKISYILPKHPTVTINQNVNSQHIIKEPNSSSFLDKKPTDDNTKSEAACCTELEHMVLKTSTEDVVKANAETNTLKDNLSQDDDCSDDVDWCDCSSLLNASKQADNDRLKRSIYFPAPIADFDEETKDDISNENTSDILSKHVCDCERIPLCYVKMLVENIETKLANANCTCDSLIPKVCPVHSKMC